MCDKCDDNKWLSTDFLACGTCGTAPCLGLFYATTETSNLKCIATCPVKNQFLKSSSTTECV